MIIYNTKYIQQAIANATFEDSRSDKAKKDLHWDNDAINSFKNYIINDNEFLQTILNNADTNNGIEDIKPMKIGLFLFEDLEVYNALKSLIQIQIIIIQDDNLFSKTYNYLWDLL